jgi:hypothetical protein
MNGREREGRDVANRLARPGWAEGRGRWAWAWAVGMGGGHGLEKPKIWIASAQGQGRAGQAGQGRGRAEQSRADYNLQPAACNAQTASSGRRRSSCNPSRAPLDLLFTDSLTRTSIS